MQSVDHDEVKFDLYETFLTTVFFLFIGGNSQTKIVFDSAVAPSLTPPLYSTTSVCGKYSAHLPDIPIYFEPINS